MSRPCNKLPEEDPLFEGSESSYLSTYNPSPYVPLPNRQTIESDSDLETPQFYKSNTIGSKTDVRQYISINNPVNLERRKSSVIDVQNMFKRVDSLRSMRPLRLIGSFKSLADWASLEKSESELKKIKKSRVRAYYEFQNELLKRYDSIDKLLDSGIHMSMIENYGNHDSVESAEGLERAPADIDIEGGKAMGYDPDDGGSLVEFAIHVNFIINVVLLLGKIFVTYLTKSMSIIASLVDSVLDLLSTFIIFLANKYASRKSSMFPIGRRRLEPIGVLVFSVIIMVSFLQVLINSISDLMNGAHEVVNLTSTAAMIMVFTIVVKILCFLWCENVNNSSIQALAEDAKTDVVFNFFSIVFPIVGSLIRIWWLDALGACSLCVYVIYQWASIAFEHINNLSGASASREDYQEILYLITRFSENINKIKNFRTYHVGDFINVEVDIVIVHPEMTMKDCHDLGESLQYAIETLPFVERSFVHLDYKEMNFVGHITK